MKIVLDAWNGLGEWGKRGAIFAMAVGFGMWMTRNTPDETVREGMAAVARDGDVFDYYKLKALIEHEELPAMVCNVSVLEANARQFARLAQEFGKTIRLATKSIRVPALIERIMAVNPHVYRGLMCYSAQEAAWWVRRGVKDILVAYPSVQECDLRVVFESQQESGGGLVLMVDCVEHVETLAKSWDTFRESLPRKGRLPGEGSGGRGDVPFEVCLDVDASIHVFGLHVGAHRSPCRSLMHVRKVSGAVARSRGAVRLVGVMSYDAQVSGLPDKNPYNTLHNVASLFLKPLSISLLAHARANVVSLLRDHGHALRIVNGGGSGGFATACSDASLTEVTAGSGMLQSAIFDWFRSSFAKPALTFALRVTRKPIHHILTCQSGGFVASGPPSRDKSPQPFLPFSLEPLSDEGFGEVQTPLRIIPPPFFSAFPSSHRLSYTIATSLSIGDPIFFRPAKAGEIAERFNTYILIDSSQDNIIGTPKTYRGLGLAFF